MIDFTITCVVAILVTGLLLIFLTDFLEGEITTETLIAIVVILAIMAGALLVGAELKGLGIDLFGGVR